MQCGQVSQLSMLLCVVSLSLLSCSKSKPSEAKNNNKNDTYLAVTKPQHSSARLMHTHSDTGLINSLPFFVELGSSKPEVTATIDIPTTIYGIDMLCNDEIYSLPTWSIVYGKPRLVSLSTNSLIDSTEMTNSNNLNATINTNLNTGINFSQVFMTLDADNRLQRSVLTQSVINESMQNEVYELLKSYLDSAYSVTPNPPSFSKTMPTNEVIKGYYEPFYLGQVYEGMVTYQTDTGYTLLYKRTKGDVVAPDSMRFSLNGLFAEYANLGSDKPVWMVDTPKIWEIIVINYSSQFATVYASNCGD